MKKDDDLSDMDDEADVHLSDDEDVEGIPHLRHSKTRT